MSRDNSTTPVEPEIIDQNSADYDPLLNQNVKERSYTQHHASEATTFEELKEPAFEKPPVDAFQPVNDAKAADSVFNKSYNELPKKDKEMGAEMMAQMALSLYGKGCNLLGKIPQISPTKIDRLIAEGEIDPNIQIPTEAGAVPLRAFAHEFNAEISEAFEVSDEFKEEVTPVMVRVFQKRGIGMTDEQMLGFLFLQDIGDKAAKAFMLRKASASIVDSLREKTAAMYENNRPTYTPAATSSAAPKQQEFTSDLNGVVHMNPSQDNQPEYKPAFEINNDTFMEPEETAFDTVDGKIQGFKHEQKIPDGMPDFGNPKILADMEAKAAAKNNSQKPKTARTKTTRTKTVRNRKSLK